MSERDTRYYQMLFIRWDQEPVMTSLYGRYYGRVGFADLLGVTTGHGDMVEEPQELRRGYVFYDMTEMIAWSLDRSKAVGTYTAQSQDPTADVLDLENMRPSGYQVQDFVVQSD